MFTLKRPLAFCLVTQPFGVNYANFYQDLGLKGHNGIDFRCFEDPICSSNDFTVLYAGKYDDGGIGIEMISDYYDENGYFKIIYYHLKSILPEVKKGNRFLGGQPLGISDNTGKYTTGDHLHWGLKRCDKYGNTLNYNNGYKGAIDPTPYLAKGFYDLPVDERYGEATYIPAETLMRIKYPKFNTRQIFAMMYGAWKVSEVANPSLLPVYAFLKREQFVGGMTPPFKLIM